MASGRLVFSNWMPALDADGVPIPNAQMFFYVNRTTTLATVYADEALTTPLANPVLADSSGQFVPVWADQELLFSAAIASTTLGQFDTIDDLAPSNSVGGAADKLDRDGGNPQPDFLTNVGIGVAATPVGEKRAVLEVTPEAYRTGDILAEFATNPKRSNTRALQAAIDGVSAAGGGTVRIPARLELSNANLSTTDNERFAIEMKPGVTLTGGTLIPDSTVSTVIIYGGPNYSCNDISVSGVNFDCSGIGIATPVKPSGAYQYFGGCGIAQRNGPKSTNVRLGPNSYTFPLVDPLAVVVPYHAQVTADTDGTCQGNYIEQCGGDVLQFNGGHWQCSGNVINGSSDGGIAINNGVSGSFTNNYMRRCHLGLGGGPYGIVGDTDRTLMIANNVYEECAVGQNIGWFSLWYNIVTGQSKLDSDMSPSEKADPNWKMRSPPNNLVSSNNLAINCKYSGFLYISGGAENYAPTFTNNTVVGLGSGLYESKTFTGNGSQTAFVMNKSTTSLANLTVTVNGVLKTAGSDYTATGQTVTFTTAPANNSTILILVKPVASDSMSGIGIVGSNLATVMNNKVIDTDRPTGNTNCFAYVLSGSYGVTFSENHTVNNPADIKYEETTLHLGRIYSSMTDAFTGDGTKVAFTLRALPLANTVVRVLVNNIEQISGTNYSISGTTLTFTSVRTYPAGVPTDTAGAPASGAVIGAQYAKTLQNTVTGAVSILSSPNNITGSFTANGGFVVDSGYYLGKSGNNPVINFDPNDFIEFERVTNEFRFNTGAAKPFKVTDQGILVKLNNGAYLPTVNGELTFVQEAGEPTKVQLLAKCNDGTVRYKNITLDNT